MISRFEDLCSNLSSANFQVDENLLAAIVLGFSANQNIVISAKHPAFVEKYIKLIASNVLGTIALSVNCKDLSWDSLCKAMVESGNIPKIVIFHNLELASSHIQVSLLNALTKRCIYIKGVSHPLPAYFLGICLTGRNSDALNKHLKQHFFFEHNYEGNHNDEALPAPKLRPIITDDFFKLTRYKATQKVSVTADVKRYMQDITVFLRTQRLVRGGVSSKACKDLDMMVRILAVLQDYSFVTPSIVSMAARQILPLKIELCDPSDEPTLQYGGDIKVVTKWMQKWDRQLVIDDVLDSVQPPI